MRKLFKSALFCTALFYSAHAQEEPAPAEEPQQVPDSTDENKRVVVSDTPPDLGEGQVAITRRIVKTQTNADGTTSEIVSYETVQVNDVDENGNIIGYKAPSKKNYRPTAILLDPKPRAETNFTGINKQPCGGLPKGQVHYLQAPDSRNFIMWKIVHPSKVGNCTVRIGGGDDEAQFTTLFPRDGSADSEGKFACGRQSAAYEGKEFRFPKNLACESCTLQWEWEIEDGQIHQCADMVLLSSQVEDCAGKCQNGGVCVNGECKCRDNYQGTYCQYKAAVSSRMWLWFVIYLIMIVIIGAIVFATWHFRRQIAKYFKNDQQPEPSGPPAHAGGVVVNQADPSRGAINR